MANDVVKIKCPQCGAVLSIKKMVGLETKNVTCPVCKYKGKYTSFRSYSAKLADETDYGNGEHTNYKGGSDNTEGTDYDDGLNILPGQLRILSTSQTFKLMLGKNVVGRKASQSSATIQLPTDGNKRMSREHLTIEVKKVPGKGMTAYASLYKQKVNKTYINNEELIYGEIVPLHDGSIISLPDMKVKYEIPDDEKTEM